MTTKKPHGSRHVRKGVPTPAAPDLKALYVELAVEDHERYKRMAEAAGMTMRDFVRLALEGLARGHDAAMAARTQLLASQQYLSPERTAAAHADLEAHRELMRQADAAALRANAEELSVPEQLYGSTRGDSAALRGLLLHAERISRLEDDVRKLREIVDGMAP
jgi:hypothetical protein